jgi:nickel-dependent lactate racemase
VLPYGASEIRATWPGGLARLDARGVPAASDPGEVVRRALAGPISSPPLERAARGARDCVVVVSDTTRETVLPIVLPAIFESLERAGVPPERTSVLVAYGNHARSPDADIERLAGPLPPGVRIAHHDSSDDTTLAGVGRLPSGHELRLNRLAVEADMVVLTGAVTFHYHAGFTGGRKSVLPGIAARANVLANHALILSASSPGGRDPRCAPGRLEGNPVHEEMVAAAGLLAARLPRPAFLANVVLTDGGEPTAFFAGDVFAAHERGAAFVDSSFRAGAEGGFDVALASAGGRPRDLTFYQAHKAFDHAARAVRDGGVVVLGAECADGAGPGFLEWFDHATYDGHLAALRGGFAVPGQTALALRQKLERVRGVLVSRMPVSDVERMGLIPARDLAEAVGLARSLAPSRGRPEACIMPHASTVLPGLAGSACAEGRPRPPAGP